MSGYFQPVRRKLGAVTLAFTCALAAAWVRSQTTCDLIILGRLIVVSGGQKLLVRPFAEGVLVEFTGREFGQSALEQTTRRIKSSASGHNAASLWTLASISSIRASISTIQNHDDNQADEMISYWLIVIPLSLVSACLLLSRPPASNRLGTLT